jgi:hypothetical protein
VDLGSKKKLKPPGFTRSTSPTGVVTPSALEPFRSVSVTSQQFEIERPLSTTIPSKKQQTFDLTAHVLKIVEGLSDENRTSLKGMLQRRTNLELRKGTGAENMKENNKIVKAIMGLDLPINTTSTYYDIITELEKLLTIVSKEKKTSKPKTKSFSSLIHLSEYTPTQLPSSQLPSSQKPP